MEQIDPGEDAKDDAVIGADDTGMLAGEQLITAAAMRQATGDDEGLASGEEDLGASEGMNTEAESDIEG